MTFLAKWLLELPRLGYHPDPAVMELSKGPGTAGWLVFLVATWSDPLVPLLGSILEACHVGSAISVGGQVLGRAGDGETSTCRCV